MIYDVILVLKGAQGWAAIKTEASSPQSAMEIVARTLTTMSTTANGAVSFIKAERETGIANYREPTMVNTDFIAFLRVHER